MTTAPVGGRAGPGPAVAVPVGLRLEAEPASGAVEPVGGQRRLRRSTPGAWSRCSRVEADGAQLFEQLREQLARVRRLGWFIARRWYGPPRQTAASCPRACPRWGTFRALRRISPPGCCRPQPGCRARGAAGEAFSPSGVQNASPVLAGASGTSALRLGQVVDRLAADRHRLVVGLDPGGDRGGGARLPPGPPARRRAGPPRRGSLRRSEPPGKPPLVGARSEARWCSSRTRRTAGRSRTRLAPRPAGTTDPRAAPPDPPARHHRTGPAGSADRHQPATAAM